MNRSSEDSLSRINLMINKLRPGIEGLVEYADPVGFQEMLLDVFSRPLSLIDLPYAGEKILDTNPHILESEQKLLDEYNSFKKMLSQVLKSGYQLNILKVLDVNRDKDLNKIFGGERELDPDMDLATDFSQAVESLGGSFVTVYTYWLFFETTKAACTRKSSSAEIWNDKGYELAERGKYTEALACYEQAIELSPDYHLAWVNTGIALKNLDKYQSAIECYDHVINEIDSSYKKAWHNNAVALQLLGDTERAYACCERALEIDPEYDAAIRFKMKLVEHMRIVRLSEMPKKLTNLRAKPALVGENDIARVLLERGFNHPNPNNMGRCGSTIGTFHPRYEPKIVSGDRIVIEQSYGLIWQYSVSHSMLWEDGRDYVKQLNEKLYAGYHDWRLPTIEELLTLLESAEKCTNQYKLKLYIDPVFDTNEMSAWSADSNSDEDVVPDSHWGVNFYMAVAGPWNPDSTLGVRAVRSM